MHDIAIRSSGQGRFLPSATELLNRMAERAMAISALMILISGALLTYVVDEIQRPSWLNRVDASVALFFHHLGSAWSISAFEAVTFFGEASTLAVVSIVILLVLVCLKRWSLLCGCAANLLGMATLNALLKAAIHRSRPNWPDPWITESDWSFPSGHALGSLVIFGFLAYLLSRFELRHFPRWFAFTTLAVLALLIGLSRIFLGVHFLSDVIGGYIVATGWLTSCILLTHRMQMGPRWINSNIRSRGRCFCEEVA